MFASESPGWSYALAGHHRADLTGTAAAGVEAPGAAGVNMAGTGVEAVIALRSALALAGFVETGQAAEGNQGHPPVSPGSGVSTGILRPLPRYDRAQPPLEVEPAQARDVGT